MAHGPRPPDLGSAIQEEINRWMEIHRTVEVSEMAKVLQPAFPSLTVAQVEKAVSHFVTGLPRSE